MLGYVDERFVERFHVCLIFNILQRCNTSMTYRELLSVGLSCSIANVSFHFKILIYARSSLSVMTK